MAAAKDALETWRDQGARLIAMGSMTDGDWVVLEQYCLSVWRMRECARILQRDGLVIVGDDGRMQRHPATGIASEAERSMRAAGAELGLSPSSRRKVTKVGETLSDDDADFA